MVKSNSFRLNRSIGFSLIFATGFIFVAYLLMNWQPILADEWDFYRSMTNWQTFRSLIPHPQAYIHFAQLMLAIFGRSFGAARMVGVLGNIVSIWLIPVLIKYLWPDHPQRQQLTVLAILSTAINPLTLQNAMLLDIDNTLLIPFVMLVLIAWAATLTTSTRRRIITMGGVLTAALWVKLPTPMMLMVCFAVYHLLRLEWRKILEVVLAAILGAAGFGTTFLIYSQISGYQWAYFAPSFGKAGEFFNLANSIVRFPQGFGVFAMWLSLPLSILLVCAIIASVRRFVRRATQTIDALILLSTIIIFYYTWSLVPPWGYPRYQAPFVPIIGIIIASFILPFMNDLIKTITIQLGTVAVVVIAIQIIAMIDPLRSLYLTTFESDVSNLGARLVSGAKVVGVESVLLGISLTAAVLISRKWLNSKRIILANMLILLTAVSWISTDFIQVNANYSTRYHYALVYADLAWSINEIQSIPGTPYVLANKDIIYLSNLPGEEVYDYLCDTCASKFLEKLKADSVSAMAWTTREDERAAALLADPQVVQELAACYTKSTQGAFIVFRRTGSATCP